jgi:hypothetical protein
MTYIVAVVAKTSPVRREGQFISYFLSGKHSIYSMPTEGIKLKTRDIKPEITARPCSLLSCFCPSSIASAERHFKAVLNLLAVVLQT